MYTFFLSVKAIHVIAIICWMAALLYLPRLFVYHSTKSPQEQKDSYMTFCTMERKLINIIMHPSMLVSLISGMVMILSVDWYTKAIWLHIKLLLVLMMIWCHFYFVRVHRDFVAQRNSKSEKFFRMINEVPSLLMIVIVVLVVVKPWE